MSAANLRRRLGKLQAVWTDSSGLIPNSKEWVEYWYRLFMLNDPPNPGRKARCGGDIVQILRAVVQYDGPLADAARRDP